MASSSATNGGIHWSRKYIAIVICTALIGFLTILAGAPQITEGVLISAGLVTLVAVLKDLEAPSSPGGS